MTDEHFPISPSAPPPPTEADYEAIAAAVMETVRGRWFLGEFAKRNRNADTELILKRIDRIETPRQPAVSPAERVRIDLVEMAKAIAQTRREIAAIKPDGDARGTLSEASEELGSIVQTTERATSDILAAAEQIQEIAWTLRERGADAAICDALDQRATSIYSACSFQDLTGQRTRKVVDVLQFLEDRIRAMIEIWGGAVPEEDGAPAAVVPHVGKDRTAPRLEQQDIDRMMPAARPAAARTNGHDGAAAGPATAVQAVMTPAVAVVGATALALDHATPVEIARQPQPAPAPEPAPQPRSTPEADAQSGAAQPDPMSEPTPAAEAAAAPDEPRADPAAVLKRILAIIRAPSEPVAARAAATEVPNGPVATLPTGAVVEETSSAPAAVTVPAEPGPPPQAAVDDAADDILMPLPGPVTVDQAVDEMLKARGRANVAAARADAAAPRLEEPAGEPAAMEAEAAAAARASRPLVIDMPEFKVASPAEPAALPERAPTPLPEPGPEAPAEPPPTAESTATAETVAAPLDQPAAPEAPAVAAELHAEPAEEARPATPEPPAPTASETPPPADAVAAPARPIADVAIASPAPRYQALAAIAALGDDEKLALFS